MHEISPINSRQFTIDDNKLIRYMSQNWQRVFGLRYPVHDPTFVPKLLHNAFTESAIARDNKSSMQVRQLHRNDGSGCVALYCYRGLRRQSRITRYACRHFHACGVRLRRGTSISPSGLLIGRLLRNLVRVQTSAPISEEWIWDMPVAGSSRTTCTMAPSIR